MTVAGNKTLPRRTHQANIIWTEAKLSNKLPTIAEQRARQRFRISRKQRLDVVGQKRTP